MAKTCDTYKQELSAFLKKYPKRRTAKKLIFNYIETEDKIFWYPTSKNNYKIKQFIIMREHIGSGSYGKVYLAKSKDDTTKTYVLKTLHSRGRARTLNFFEVQKEVAIGNNINTLFPGYTLKSCLYYKTKPPENFYNCPQEDQNNWKLQNSVIISSPPGEDLFDFMNLIHWNISIAKPIICQLFYILLSLRLCKTVHCDLKFENMIFEKDGSIILIDYGTCMNENYPDLPKNGMTPQYMAPENLKCHKSDIYSVGKLIEYLYYGISYNLIGRGYNKFIEKLTMVDLEKRPSIEDILTSNESWNIWCIDNFNFDDIKDRALAISRNPHIWEISDKEKKKIQ